MRLIAIDPSIRSVGVAIGRVKEAEPDSWSLHAALSLRVPQRATVPSWRARAQAMARAVVSSIRPLDGGTVVGIEQPDNWATGRGVTSKDAGSIQKLYWFVGFLAGLIRSHSCSVVLATPKEWKGSTPKKITRQRVDRALDQRGLRLLKGATEDTYDAVGLWLWLCRGWSLMEGAKPALENPIQVNHNDWLRGA